MEYQIGLHKKYYEIKTGIYTIILFYISKYVFCISTGNAEDVHIGKIDYIFYFTIKYL